jgi:hypothetical protein
MALPARTKLKFTVKARVTEQLIKLELDTEYFVKFDSAFYKAKKNGTPRTVAPGVQEKEPPYLAKITLLDDSSQGVMIIPQVLRTEIDDYYPDEAYVGLQFRIVRHKLEGKSYNTFDIAEIETDGELEELPSTVEDIEHADEVAAASANFNEDEGLNEPDHGTHKKGKKK